MQVATRGYTLTKRINHLLRTDLRMMSIANFYENRDIFVTGATGFLGKSVLEKLLRSCNVRRIYVLIRSKKGVNAEERKKEMFRAKIFENLSNNPDLLNKVRCIEGNITQENLGISSADMKSMTEDVSVVLHAAASVKFNEPFRNSFVNNVESTRNVAEFCRRLKKLSTFVHVSTAYCFCDRATIGETIYPLSRTYEEFKDISNLDNDFERLEVEKIIGSRPNVYTLTKAIAENLLNSHYRDLPIAIVRPSIIGGSWKEPFQGWIDGVNGPNLLIAAGLQGTLFSMRVDEDKISDWIPADTVVNLTIAAAWRKGIMQHKMKDEIPVYNCTTGSINPLKWGEFFEFLKLYSWNYPSRQTFLYPTKIPRKNYLSYRLSNLIQPQLPAVLTEVFHVAVGKEAKMTNIYKKLHQTANGLEYFTTREWNLLSNNVKELLDKIPMEDKENFNFDVSQLEWKDYLEQHILGIRRYFLKEDDSTVPAARKRLFMKYYFLMMLQTGLFLGFIYCLSLFF